VNCKIHFKLQIVRLSQPIFILHVLLYVQVERTLQKLLISIWVPEPHEA